MFNNYSPSLSIYWFKNLIASSDLSTTYYDKVYSKLFL